MVQERKNTLLVMVPLSAPIPLLLQTHNNPRVDLSKNRAEELTVVGVIFQEVLLIYVV